MKEMMKEMKERKYYQFSCKKFNNFKPIEN